LRLRTICATTTAATGTTATTTGTTTATAAATITGAISVFLFDNSAFTVLLHVCPSGLLHFGGEDDCEFFVEGFTNLLSVVVVLGNKCFSLFVSEAGKPLENIRNKSMV